MDHDRASWFALSHPGSPPAVCFEFELPESVLLVIMQMNPVGAIHHLPNDYEFLAASHTFLNDHMTSKNIVDVT